jgi:hypothetical protein
MVRKDDKFYLDRKFSLKKLSNSDRISLSNICDLLNSEDKESVELAIGILKTYPYKMRWRYESKERLGLLIQHYESTKSKPTSSVYSFYDSNTWREENRLERIFYRKCSISHFIKIILKQGRYYV